MSQKSKLSPEIKAISSGYYVNVKLMSAAVGDVQECQKERRRIGKKVTQPFWASLAKNCATHVTRKRGSFSDNANMALLSLNKKIILISIAYKKNPARYDRWPRNRKKGAITKESAEAEAKTAAAKLQNGTLPFKAKMAIDNIL